LANKLVEKSRLYSHQIAKFLHVSAKIKADRGPLVLLEKREMLTPVEMKPVDLPLSAGQTGNFLDRLELVGGNGWKKVHTHTYDMGVSP
jgi:hypothetical protein